eukprot:jgi/Sobl393_1/18922/SZX72192.1
MENKRKVSYFYDAELGDFYYGPTHPMKPHRVRMAHDLIVRYDLYKHLQVYTPVPCPFDDMCSFHSREYLEGLKSVDAPKVRRGILLLLLLLLLLLVLLLLISAGWEYLEGLKSVDAPK